MTDLRGQDQEHRHGPARGTVIAIAVAVVVGIAVVLWLITSMGAGTAGIGGY